MGFPRQEYWSVLPFPSPGDLPDPGIKPTSIALAGRFFLPEPPGKPIPRNTLSQELEFSQPVFDPLECAIYSIYNIFNTL